MKKLFILLCAISVLTAGSIFAADNSSSCSENKTKIHKIKLFKKKKNNTNINTLPDGAVMVKKPAIYLYPTITTKVNVKLDKSIKYQTTIPVYKKKGWNVEAEPTGSLRDLQPNYTKCSNLPKKQFGLEYAQDACKYNKYPFIFWDGAPKDKVPAKSTGFIVAKEDIATFLASKADEMQFSSDEKNDFVKYWAKEMRDANWSYYRVYFLQNEDVDMYIPIYVDPKPQSWNRIQIVISKGKKNEKITAQSLVPIKRDGFTLVEWGGMINK